MFHRLYLEHRSARHDSGHGASPNTRHPICRPPLLRLETCSWSKPRPWPTHPPARQRHDPAKGEFLWPFKPNCVASKSDTTTPHSKAQSADPWAIRMCLRACPGDSPLWYATSRGAHIHFRTWPSTFNIMSPTSDTTSWNSGNVFTYSVY